MLGPRSENLLWVGLVVLIGAASALEHSLVAGVLVAAGSVAIYRWPEAALHLGVIAAIVIRPAIDILSERRLGVGPFTSSPAVVCGIAVLLVALVLGASRLAEGRPIWPDRRLFRIHLWVLAAVAIGMLSGTVFYGGVGAASAVRELFRIASVLAAFLLVLWWVEKDPRRYDVGWTYLVLGAAVPIALSMWQYVTGSGNREIPGLNRLQGTFSHPNSLGAWLVPFILISIGGVLSGDVRGRILRFVVAVGLTLLLVQTFSRTSMLILFAGLLALPILQARGLGRQAVARAAGTVLLFGLLGWLLAGTLIRERFADLFTSSVLFNLTPQDAENSLQWRLGNWAGLVALGLEHPLIGHGAGMTTALNPNIAVASGIPFSAHNDFVRVFFESGLLGLACYLIYGMLLCGWAVRQARAAPREEAPYAFAVAASLIAIFFLTAGTPEFGLQTAIQYELYGMLALLTATTRQAPATPGESRVPREPVADQPV